ncbi:MAG: hypothetical protein JWP19_1748 [Rhodoglobus sp.]|nr:hypothetical protein [Rhodoglobus sp.]
MGLTGCGPGGGAGGSPTVVPPVVERPTAAVSPSPTPSGPVPAFVVISAHGVGVGDSDSRQIADVPFTTDLARAAAQLTTAMGTAPTVIPVPATPCQAATSIYDWGGLQITFDPYMTDIGDTQFVATVTATHTAAGLELDGPYNQTVGMSLADVLSHVPGSVSGDRGEGHIEALLDPQEDNLWGVVMTFTAGVADGFHAPGVYIVGHGFCEAGT